MYEAPAIFRDDDSPKARVVSRGSVFLPKLALPILVLSVFACLIATVRVFVPSVPINVDPAYYAVVSHKLLNGESLYTDIWDHKPPAPFIVYGAAELLLGYGPNTLLILNFVLTIGMLVLLFMAGRCGPGGDISGYLAAALWTLCSGSIGLEGRDPNTEIMMNALLTGAFLLFVSSPEIRLTNARAVFCGVLFLFATLFKPVVVAAAVLICIAHVVTSREHRAALKNVLVIAAVGFAGWAATFGYFVFTGRGAIFTDSMIAFNQSYSGSIFANLIAPLRGNAELLIDVIAPLAVFAFVGFVLLFWFEKRKAVFVLGFIAAGWFAIAARGRFSVHYYQLWLPPLIIASAWGLGVLVGSKMTAIKSAGAVASFVLILGVMFAQYSEIRAVLNGNHVPVVEKLAHSSDAVAVVNSKLRSDETFFLWGITTNLYLLADRRPPTPIIFDSHLDAGPMQAILSERVRIDLEKNRPELLVVEQGRPKVPDWIFAQYRPEPIYLNSNSYSIYVRRDGRIADETPQ
ncbi:MAG TPA: hypothetical protein PKA82_07370 [Pyrinomonadaceae bacterium]|nr:hypothetical protein [Pyrinomonadaceae bacterium]